MAQSMNSQVDYQAKASFMGGLASTGNVLIGNKAFEYYNERNVEDFVQIPWEEVDYVSAEVIGRHITRFSIFTKRNGHFTFSARDNKAMIRAIRDVGHIPPDRLLKSMNFFQAIGHGLMYLPHFIADKLSGKGKEKAAAGDAKDKKDDKGKSSKSGQPKQPSDHKSGKRGSTAKKAAKGGSAGVRESGHPLRRRGK